MLVLTSWRWRESLVFLKCFWYTMQVSKTQPEEFVLIPSSSRTQKSPKHSANLNNVK